MEKGRAEDCEYTADIQGLTRTQMLEENIAILEQRIRELENPGDAASVQLRNVAGPSHAQARVPAVADPSPRETHNLYISLPLSCTFGADTYTGSTTSYPMRRKRDFSSTFRDSCNLYVRRSGIAARWLCR